MIRSRLLCLKPIALALAALLLFLAAGEVGLRVYDSYTGGFSQRDGDPLIARSWVTHHELKPLRTVAVPPPDGGEPIGIATNSYGTRGSDVAVPKPPNVYRIVCLGDEATFAAEVPEELTFCERLRQALQPHTRFQIEVINAGVPGYCPLLSCLQVKHSLTALQPDLVVLNFDMSDVADDYLYRRHTHVDGQGRPLACPHPELEAAKHARAERWDDRLLLARWAKGEVDWLTEAPGLDERRDISAAHGRYAWLKDNPPDWSAYIQQALSPIEHLHATADYLYAQLVVAAHPAPWQVSATACADEVRAAAGIAFGTMYRSRRPFELLQAWHGQRGILFCDTSPAFQNAARPDDLYLRNAPRFSPAGHELYARELAGFLIENVPGLWSRGPSPGAPYAPAPQQAARTPWDRAGPPSRQ